MARWSDLSCMPANDMYVDLLTATSGMLIAATFTCTFSQKPTNILCSTVAYLSGLEVAQHAYSAMAKPAPVSDRALRCSATGLQHETRQRCSSSVKGPLKPGKHQTALCVCTMACPHFYLGLLSPALSPQSFPAPSSKLPAANQQGQPSLRARPLAQASLATCCSSTLCVRLLTRPPKRLQPSWQRVPRPSLLPMKGDTMGSPEASSCAPRRLPAAAPGSGSGPRHQLAERLQWSWPERPPGLPAAFAPA